MSADVKAEKLFLVRKLFMLTPPGSESLSRCCRRSCLIKQRNLASQPVPLRCNGCTHRIINADEQFGAVLAKKIKRAGLDEAFQHLPVGNARIQPRAEILQ